MRKRLLGTLPSFLGGVVGGIVAVSILGASPTKASSATPQMLETKIIKANEIRTNSITIRDAKLGKPIATLDSNGMRFFSLNSDDTTISLNSQLGTISIDRSADQPSVFLSNLGLALFSKTNEMRASLTVEESGSHFSIMDSSGKERIALGQSELVIKTSGVKEKTKPGSIVIFDEVGNVVWQAPR